MLKDLRPALVMVALMTGVTGLAYPIAMTGLAGLVLPRQSAGSLVERNGTVVGSALIGQAFAGARYFHGRPSATTGPDPTDPSKSVAMPYNAANSMGANLGPGNKALIDRIKGDAAALAVENPAAPVPVDLVTTSASGLDPDISPESAYFQVPRVAKARNMSADKLRTVVDANVEDRLLGVFGEPRVNVLALNLALDEAGTR